MNISEKYSGRNSFFTINFLFTLIFSVVLFSCKKSDQSSTIPYVPVNCTVYLTLPQYSSLNSTGSYAYVDGYGYRGLIVYRRQLDEFVAFDLACPYDPAENGAKLKVDSSGITMIDPHCGSKFNLYDGSILKGPATLPMKSYATTYDANSNAVYITN